MHEVIHNLNLPVLMHTSESASSNLTLQSHSNKFSSTSDKDCVENTIYAYGKYIHIINSDYCNNQQNSKKV